MLSEPMRKGQMANEYYLASFQPRLHSSLSCDTNQRNDVESVNKERMKSEYCQGGFHSSLSCDTKKKNNVKSMSKARKANEYYLASFHSSLLSGSVLRKDVV